MQFNLKNIKKIMRKAIRIAGWLCLGLVTLLLFISLLIQVPFVQNAMVQKAVVFLADKIGTPVSLARISVSFPKTVVLEGLYVQDQFEDTLAYAGRLGVNTDLLALFSKRIQLNQIELHDIKANVKRSEKGIFNFDYILLALSGQEPAQDSTSKGWTFSMREIELERNRIRIEDNFSGNNLDLNLGSLRLQFDEFDPGRNIFRIEELSIADVGSVLIQSRPAQTPVAGTEGGNESAANPPKVGLQRLDLKNIDFQYSQTVSGQEIGVKLGNAQVEGNNIDLAREKISLKKFLLSNTFVAVHRLLHAADTSTSVRGPADESNAAVAWSVSVDELGLHDNSVQYYDFNEQRKAGMDPNHIWVSGIQMEAREIVVEENNYQAKLNSFSFKDRNGFVLNDLSSSFRITGTRSDVEEFELETQRSHIRLQVHAEYPSLASITYNFPATRVKANVKESFVSAADVNQIAPELMASVPLKLADLNVYADGEVEGNLDTIQIKGLLLKAMDHTTLEASGSIRGTSHPRTMGFDVALNKFETNDTDLKNLLPDSLLPAGIALPAWVTLAGDFTGTSDKPATRSVLESEFGSIEIQASLDLDTVSTPGGYKGHLKVNHFNLGKLLQRPDMGMLDLEGEVEGKGFTMEDLDLKADVTVHEFEFRKYNYRDLFIDGRFDRTAFTGKAAIHDPNLAFELDGHLDSDYKNVKGEYHFNLILSRADLYALHLTDRPLTLGLDIAVDLDEADPKNLNGVLELRNAEVYNGKTVYRIDTLRVVSINKDGRSSLRIDSDAIQGEFTGTFDLPGLPGVLEQYFHTYYSLRDKSLETSMPSQQFEFNFDVRNTAMLTEVFFPEIERIVPGAISGSFNSDRKQLDLTIEIKEFDHVSFTADNLAFSVTSDKRHLVYKFNAENIRSGVLYIPGLEFGGDVAQDSILAGLFIYDSLGEKRYAFEGVFQSVQNAYHFSFLPDRILLNYNTWLVPDDNSIAFGKDGFGTNNLSLSYNDQEVRIESHLKEDSTLNVSLHQLDIKNLTEMALPESVDVRGILQGVLKIHKNRNRGPVEADIDIKNLTIDKVACGDVNLIVDQEDLNKTRLHLSADGKGADFEVNGSLGGQGTTSLVDLQADIKTLNLATVAPLVVNQVNELRGSLQGRISIAGNMNSPEVDGSLTFKDVEVTPSYSNSRLKLENEKLQFNGSTLVLDDFTVKDVKNNAFTLSGTVVRNQSRRYVLNLSATAKDFQLLDTREEYSDLFYGQVRINTSAKISGTLEHPEVNMTVGLGDESELTYVVPQTEAGILDQKGVVTFVDKDESAAVIKLAPHGNDPTDTLSLFKGVTLTARVELRGKETLTIVLDPVTGDKLVVNGRATLTLDIDETGNTSLSGRYELTSGSYDFTFYKLVKRNFQIEPGSTIIWSGEPLNAEMDITARYRLEASPIDLFSNQVTGSAGVDQYRQRLPFIVFLSVKGELLSPLISFRLDMPQQQQGALGGSVYAKLLEINSRESDLNKQVFALLILQRFVSENPFETQSAGALEVTARTSVNRLLSDQLNRMAENIKGVELTFDFQSYTDYSDGQTQDKTQLQLGVSKRLLNDRLVVKLSGNVNLEGGGNQQSTLTDYIGDLALEYKLTEDGRFRINGFYNSDYDMIDGELKEAGVGLIYIKDYNSLKELFKPNEQTRK